MGLALVLAAVLAAVPPGPGAALAADTTPPVISAVRADATTDRITVNWTTDEPADGTLENGTGTDYASAAPASAALTTAHSLSFGVVPSATGATRHYRVLSRDAAGNLAASGDFTATTLPDNAPPVITDLRTTADADGVTVTWTTDEGADRQVEYGTSTGYGSETALDGAARTTALSHAVPLVGLTPGVLYHYRVLSRDVVGNQAVSADQTVTATADTTPPAISAVGTYSVLATTAGLTWLTDELADAQVEYGPTTAYGTSPAANPSLATSHTWSLTDLTPGTLYHYRVKSRDAAGNLATSADFTFTTGGTPPAPPTGHAATPP
jgi:fibronectin type 3 domain-containing protein